MSSPLSNLRQGRRAEHAGTKKRSDQNFKLPSLAERNRQLHGRSHHTAIEAFNYDSPRDEPEMPNLLFDYTDVDIAKKENTACSLSEFHTERQSPPEDAPTRRSNFDSDSALLTMMTARLRAVETQLREYSREIIDKDRTIRILEDKVKILSAANASASADNPSKLRKAEQQILFLQQQIYEMEKFLQDYGMIWVGDSAEPADEADVSDSETPIESVWNPRKSIGPIIEFDRIIRNIKELNVLVGEGVAKITQTGNGATLRVPDPVSLVFHADGFILFEGPFRSYTDEYSPEFIQDLTDGYFPSELQPRYPDGIPFAVKDLRDVAYLTPNSGEEEVSSFPGSGKRIGSTIENRVIESGPSAGTRRRLTVEQFTRKLPKSVVKNGKVIDIRADLTQHITGDDIKSTPDKPSHPDGDGAILLETALMCEVYKMESSGEPETSTNETTLRIRSESGQQVYVARMYKHETIGDLRGYIDAVREQPSSAAPYEIRTTYPARSYGDDEQTLEDAGLVPNAVLFLKAPKSQI